jgi:hypothetical protein
MIPSLLSSSARLRCARSTSATTGLRYGVIREENYFGKYLFFCTPIPASQPERHHPMIRVPLGFYAFIRQLPHTVKSPCLGLGAIEWFSYKLGHGSRAQDQFRPQCRWDSRGPCRPLATGVRAFMFELYETAGSPHGHVEHLACLPSLPALHYRVSRFQSPRVRTEEAPTRPRNSFFFREVRPAGEQQLSSRLIGVSCADNRCLITKLAFQLLASVPQPALVPRWTPQPRPRSPSAERRHSSKTRISRPNGGELHREPIGGVPWTLKTRPRLDRF